MQTIVVPIEKCKAKSPKSMERGRPITTYMEINETKSHGIGEMDTKANSLKSILRVRSDKDYLDEQIPPPYVIWVQYMGQGGGGAAQNYEVDEPLDYDPQTRNSFVRKVFTIVFIMLLATALIAAVIHMAPSARRIFARNWLLILISCLIILMGAQYAIFCSPCARKSPVSFILLTLVAIASGILTAAVTLHTRTIIIYCVLAATAVVVFICILLAMSSFDFTKYMLYIVMISLAMCAMILILGIVRFAFNIEMRPLHIGILIVATLVSMVVFAMELQMILGGRTVELSVDDWAIAALMVYMSILDIFWKLLALGNLFDQ